MNDWLTDWAPIPGHMDGPDWRINYVMPMDRWGHCCNDRAIRTYFPLSVHSNRDCLVTWMYRTEQNTELSAPIADRAP